MREDDLGLAVRLLGVVFPTPNDKCLCGRPMSTQAKSCYGKCSVCEEHRSEFASTLAKYAVMTGWGVDRFRRLNGIKIHS